MTQTIVENEYITLVYLPEKGVIYHTIHQPVEGQPLRDALLKGTAFLREHGVTKWLSDDRKNGPLSPEDAAWGIENWNQQTIEAGWKYWANVVPKEVEAAGSLTPTMNSLYEMGLRMMVFSSLEEAFEWLDSLE
ncbi:MAG: hypothetical protein OHK0046_00300 [Anaerolineae bacterium]